MNWRKKVTGVSTALALLLCVSCTEAADSKGVDIVGLELGMTVEEAQEAIRKHNPDLTIQPPVEKVYQYRVANETRKTEPFVSFIYAFSNKSPKESIYVYFSLPPSEPRAVAISRSHSKFASPMLRENYYKALTEKYGEPSATMKDIHGPDSTRIHWYQWHVGEGKVQCAPTFGGGREVTGSYGSIGTNAVEQGEVLKRISADRGALPEAGDPAACATILTYQLTYEPLNAANGQLIDVAAAAKSEQQLSQWLDELVRQGEEEIKKSTAAPKL